MPRIVSFLIIMIISMSAVLLVGTRGGAYSTQPPIDPNPSSDLIAFVNSVGQVNLIRPNGTSVRVISEEGGFFTWPTWSPDGERIAYSGIPPATTDSTSLTLYVNEPMTGVVQEVYQNEDGMGPILPGMPHYLLWSPDASQLSFMASVPQGLTLFLHDIESREDPSIVLRNSPLYAAWSDDSRFMLVHAGPDHFLVDADTAKYVRDNTSNSNLYRAPAWLPDTTTVALLSQQSQVRSSLYTANVEVGDDTPVVLGEFENTLAFLWSPDGSAIAVAESADGGALVYNGVKLFSPEGKQLPSSIDGPVIAYFWSPDGTKIAFVTITRTRGVFEWHILDVASGETWPLVDFSPSRDQFTVFQFFDQFAYSHSPWAHDSSALVFSGEIQIGGVSAALNQQPVPGVYVMDVGPSPLVQRIADGFFAVWSPR